MRCARWVLLMFWAAAAGCETPSGEMVCPEHPVRMCPWAVELPDELIAPRSSE